MPTVREELAKYLTQSQMSSFFVDNLKIFNVKSYGAKGDGVTDDTADIQETITAAFDAGGGIVFFPVGTYIITNTIGVKNNIVLYGVYPNSIIKQSDGANKQLLYNPTASTGGTLDDVTIDGLVFDGNKSNNTAATSAVDLSGVKRLTIRRCNFQNSNGYGLGHQSRPGHPSGFTGEQSDIYVENCIFSNNGSGGLFDGVDIKDCDRVNFVGCVSYGNAEDGFDIRGENVTMTGCTAYSNGKDGFELLGNVSGEEIASTIDLVSCHAYLNSENGVQIDDGVIDATQIVRVNITGGFFYSNTLHGIKQSAQTGDRVEFTVSGANCYLNTGAGISLEDTNLRAGVIANCIFRSNGSDGIKNASSGVEITNCNVNSNTGYGYRETGSADNNIVSLCSLLNNTSGSVLNVGAGSVFAKNRGFRTEVNALSAGFAVDSTGVKTVNIAHTLSFTPNVQDCQICVKRETAVTDYVIGWVRVLGTDATNVLCDANVTTASATGAAVAKLILRVKSKSYF